MERTSTKDTKLSKILCVDPNATTCQAFKQTFGRVESKYGYGTTTENTATTPTMAEKRTTTINSPVERASLSDRGKSCHIVQYLHDQSEEHTDTLAHTKRRTQRYTHATNTRKHTHIPTHKQRTDFALQRHLLAVEIREVLDGAVVHKHQLT